MSQTIIADGRGRLLLPRALRERMGIRPGAAITVDTTPDGAVILRDAQAELAQQLGSARGLFRSATGSVDALIEERRRQAARDDA